MNRLRCSVSIDIQLFIVCLCGGRYFESAPVLHNQIMSLSLVCDYGNGCDFSAHLTFDGDNAYAVCSDIEKSLPTMGTVDSFVEFVKGFLLCSKDDLSGSQTIGLVGADLRVAAFDQDLQF